MSAPLNWLQTHLTELRARLLWCAGLWAVLLLVLWPLRAYLLAFFTAPYRAAEGQAALISTKLPELFTLNLKLVAFTAFMAVLPVVFYHVWRFCAPALKLPEKRWAVLVALMASMLFTGGALFAYVVVLPLVVPFFLSFQAADVATMLTIGGAVGFVLRLMLLFGVAFLLPLALMAVLGAGVVQRQTLAKNRGYVLIACCCIGAVATPSDIPSMLALAVPLYGLFEVGLITSRCVKK